MFDCGRKSITIRPFNAISTDALGVLDAVRGGPIDCVPRAGKKLLILHFGIAPPTVTGTAGYSILNLIICAERADYTRCN